MTTGIEAFARWTVVFALVGCGSESVREDDCRPLDTRCDGKAILTCHPDLDLLAQHHVVYVLDEADTCEDDEILGEGRCVETRTSTGRIEAECTWVPRESGDGGAP